MRVSKVSGAGLGLALSSTLAKSMGGSVGCRSRLDGVQGTFYWVRIPLVSQELSMCDTTAREEMEGKEISSVIKTEPKQKIGRCELARLGNKVHGPSHGKDNEAHHVPRKKIKKGSEKGTGLVDKWFDGLHILIVEDNPVNMKMLHALLKKLLCCEKEKRAGPLISFRANGQEAVNFIRETERQVDIVSVKIYCSYSESRSVNITID